MLPKRTSLRSGGICPSRRSEYNETRQYPEKDPENPFGLSIWPHVEVCCHYLCFAYEMHHPYVCWWWNRVLSPRATPRRFCSIPCGAHCFQNSKWEGFNWGTRHEIQWSMRFSACNALHKAWQCKLEALAHAWIDHPSRWERWWGDDSEWEWQGLQLHLQVIASLRQAPLPF